CDTWRAIRQGRSAASHRQRARFTEMVAFARANSSYYRDLYQDLPEWVENPTLLPVTDKKKLMARFDDWVTDRNVKLEQVQAFIKNPDLVGERFQGEYTAITTSGTTGTHGIFLLDGRNMAVTAALAVRMLSNWLTARDVIRIL